MSLSHPIEENAIQSQLSMFFGHAKINIEEALVIF